MEGGRPVSRFQVWLVVWLELGMLVCRPQFMRLFAVTPETRCCQWQALAFKALADRKLSPRTIPSCEAMP